MKDTTATENAGKQIQLVSLKKKIGIEEAMDLCSKYCGMLRIDRKAVLAGVNIYYKKNDKRHMGVEPLKHWSKKKLQNEWEKVKDNEDWEKKSILDGKSWGSNAG
jgi:hypothetical protein